MVQLCICGDRISQDSSCPLIPKGILIWYTYVKFSEKLTFLNAWYAHVCMRMIPYFRGLNLYFHNIRQLLIRILVGESMLEFLLSWASKRLKSYNFLRTMMCNWGYGRIATYIFILRVTLISSHLTLISINEHFQKQPPDVFCKERCS